MMTDGQTDGDDQLGQILAVVHERVAVIRGEASELLAARLDADLGSDLGLDSIQILSIWLDLEDQFALPKGLLGVSQAVTVRTVAAEVCRLVRLLSCGT